MARYLYFILNIILFLIQQSLRAQMKTMLRITTNIFALACFLSLTNAARILGIVTVPAISHFRFNYAILESLHSAGHQVTMIAMFPPEKKSVGNFTYIKLEMPDLPYHVGQWGIDQLSGVSLLRILGPVMIRQNSETVNRVASLSEIQNILHSSEKSYDLLLAECFWDIEYYLPIAEKLKIPIIGTTAQRSWRWADQEIGVPNNPAVVPTEQAMVSDVEMSFVQRIQNFWTTLIVDVFIVRTLREDLRNFYRKYFEDDLVGKKRVSLIFYNNHASFLPRLSVPNAIGIGGIHLEDIRPLPTNLRTFIDEAPHGVILFSLGSVLKGRTMSEERRNAFVSAFESIPQRVIWKFEDSIEKLPKNIMTSSWLPQRDILEHKNVIAFMSHCGVNSVYEAIATGTPVIAMPLFADQPGNAALLRYRKVAVNLDFKKATKETILNALDTIVNDTSYYQNMQKLSRAFKDRPMTPQQSVVYWTEYVLRHNGASHLKTLGTDMPLYKYFMLDLIIFALFTSIFSIFIIYRSYKKFRTFIANKCDHSLSVKKVTRSVRKYS